MKNKLYFFFILFIYWSPFAFAFQINTNTSADSEFANIYHSTVDESWIKTFYDSLTQEIYCFGNQVIGSNTIGIFTKLDSNKNVVFRKEYDYNSSPISFFDALQLDDGGFMVSFGYGTSSTIPICILRLDNLGNVLWTKAYSFYKNRNQGRQLIKLNHKNEFVLTSWSNRFGSARDDIILIKIDSVGTMLQAKIMGDSINEDDHITKIIPYQNGVVIVGTTSHAFSGSILWNSFIVSLDEDLNLNSRYLLDGGSEEVIMNISVLNNDTLLIVGHSCNSFREGFVFKYVPNQTNITPKFFDINSLACNSLIFDDIIVQDGDIIAGGTETIGGNDNQYLLKLDNNLNLIWAKKFDFTNAVISNIIIPQSSSKNITFTGYTGQNGLQEPLLLNTTTDLDNCITNTFNINAERTQTFNQAVWNTTFQNEPITATSLTVTTTTLPSISHSSYILDLENSIINQTNDSITFDLGTSFTNIQWSDGSTASTYTGSLAELITVQGDNGFGCMMYDTLQMYSCRYTDSLALVELYNSADGVNWTSTWNLTEPLDSFYGVTLDGNGCVSELNLNNIGLNGTLPDLKLPNLTYLLLRGYRFQDTIPNFSYLNNIETIILHVDLNRNSCPKYLPDFSNMPTLTSLSLMRNGFNGTIPNFSNLPNLRKLDLSYNCFDGTVPNFSNLDSLRELHITNNTLDSIPDFSNLPNLSWLWANNNTFTSIPNFSNLPNLQELFVHSNQLDTFPELTNMPCLRHIRICDNELTLDDIIPNIGKVSAACFSGDHEVEYNYTPQDSVGTIDTVYLSAGDNYTIYLGFDDTVNSSTYYWYRDSVFIDSTTTNKLYLFNLSIAQSGSYYCSVVNSIAPGGHDCSSGDNTNDTTFTPFQLNVRPIVIEVRSCRYTDSLALVELYDSTDGANWTNKWDLTEPLDSFYGVTLDANGCVTCLTLNGNTHNGEAECGEDSGLGNNLTGTLPNLNLPHLKRLILKGNNLSGGISDFSNLPSLEILDLRSNQLSGSIPDFDNLPNLNILLLSYNDSLSGSIPDFDKLPSLEELDLRGNQLSGGVPNFSNLLNLTILYLSNNPLGNTIPNFNSLPKLEELYLDNNQLSGTIPNFNSLPELKELNLGNNQLSGNIPHFDSLLNLNSLLLKNNQLSDSIPNFPTTKLKELKIQDNNFTFEDIVGTYISNNTLITTNSTDYTRYFYNYTTQDSAGIIQNITADLGTTTTLDLGFDDTVTTSTYYWYKNGVPYDTTYTNKYTFSSLQPTDAGRYDVVITNSVVTNLTLHSQPLFLSTQTTCRYTDSLALVEFYNAMDTASWIRSYYDNGWVDSLIRWDLALSIDNWYGVTLDSNGCVGCLYFNGSSNCGVVEDYLGRSFRHRLSGNFPDLNLSNLRYMAFRGGYFQDSLPNFSKLDNIQMMQFHITSFKHIPDLLYMPTLERLHLRSNNIKNVPNFSNLPNLIDLGLANNKLDSIPNFSKLKNLRELYLRWNNLTLVPNFDSLPNLEWLWVSHNQLKYVHNFNKLPKLQELFLQDNQLDSIPDFDNLPCLRELQVCYNNLTFDDILHNIGKTDSGCGNGNTYNYLPQSTINIADTLYATLGDSFTIYLGFDDTVTTSTYYWYQDSTIIDSTTTNQFTFNTIAITDTGTYSCKVFNNIANNTNACARCDAPLDDALNVAPFTLVICPTVDIGRDTTIQLGNSLTLGAGNTGIVTYNWSTGDSIQIISVTPTTDTSYIVAVTLGSCTVYDTIQIKVIDCLASIDLSGSVTDTCLTNNPPTTAISITATNTLVSGNTHQLGSWSIVSGSGTFGSTNMDTSTTASDTYTPSVTDMTTGAVTLRWTATQQDTVCGATITQDLTINLSNAVDTAFVTIPMGSTDLCGVGATTGNLAATVLKVDGTNLTSGSWTHNGDGFITNPTSYNTATYTSTFNDLGDTIIVTWTPSDTSAQFCNPTNITAQFPILVHNGIETVTTNGDTSVCYGTIAPTINLTASATRFDGSPETIGYWSGGNGTFADTNSATTTYTPDTSDIGTMVALVWTAVDTGFCSDKTATHYVDVKGSPVIAPAVAAGVDTTCVDGTTDLILDANPSDGGIHNYTWYTLDTTISTANGSLTIDNITANDGGTYSVIANGLNGCSTQMDLVVDITDAIPLINIIGDTLAACEGDQVMLQTTASNNPSLNYLWSTGDTILTTTTTLGTTDTTYSVTVTRANTTCQQTASITINSEAAPTIAPTVSGLLTCVNGVTPITLHPNSTGTPITTYAWSGPNGFTSSAANPIVSNVTSANSGTYTLTATSANGCTTTESIDIIITDALSLISITSGTSIACEGDIITLSTNTTDPSLNYLWSTGAPTPIITVIAGNSNATYSVTVTRTNTGCQQNASVIINSEAAPTIAPTVSGLLTCVDGYSDITLNANSTGTPITTYTWSGPNGFISNAANPMINNVTSINSGTYTLTATSANGCYTTQSMNVNITDQPINSTLTASTTTICLGESVTLTGNNYSITTTGINSYNWWHNGILLDDSTSSTISVTPDTTDKHTYTYSVTIDGCTSIPATDSVTVQSLPIVNAGQNITISTLSPPITLTGTPHGGTWSGNYITSDGLFTQNGIPNTTPVVYHYADNNGCSNTDTTQIIVYQALQTDTSDTICQGGIYTVGTSDYSTSGTYRDTLLTVGTLLDSLVILNLYVLPSSTDTITPSICAGDSYTIDTFNFAQTGTYPVTLKTSEGCDSIVVIDLTVLDTFYHDTLQIICQGEVVQVGGQSYTQSGVYTHHLQTFEGCDSTVILTLTVLNTSDTTITDTICAGDIFTVGNNNYTQTGFYVDTLSSVVNGCDSIVRLDLTVLPPLMATFSQQTNVFCHGDATGQIEINTIGGLPPYQCSINGSPFSTDSIFNNLTAGLYTITVQDAQLCNIAINTTITEPSAALALVNPNVGNNNCFGDSNGFISIHSTGGTGTPTYIWSTGDTTTAIQNLSVGNYSVTATDSLGCTDSWNGSITEPNLITIQVAENQSISCSGGQDGELMISATGGVAPYQFSIDNGITYSTDSIFSNLAANNYNIIVKDASDCIKNISYTLVEPSPIVIQITESQSISCFNVQDGELKASVTGGTSPYNYQWNGNNGTTQMITNLGVGVYTLTITDDNGCQKDTSYTLSAPPAFQSQTNIIRNVDCYGNATGIASVQVTDTANYIYHYDWSHGVSTDTIHNLSVGNYIVTITNQNGCSIIDNITITQPDSLVLDTIQTIVDTCHQRVGSITLQGSGGIAPYNITLDSNTVFGVNTHTFSSLETGYHTAYIEDNNNCRYDLSPPIFLGNICNPCQLYSPISLATCSYYNTIGALSETEVGIQVGGGKPEADGSSYEFQIYINGSLEITAFDASGMLEFIIEEGESWNVLVTDLYNCDSLWISDTSSCSCEIDEFDWYIETNVDDTTTYNIRSNNSFAIRGQGRVELTARGTFQSINWYKEGEWIDDIERIIVKTSEIDTVVNYKAIIINSRGCSDTIEITIYENVPPEIVDYHGMKAGECFVIEHIESYPNNELTIFNTWGQIVMRKENYPSCEGSSSDHGIYLPPGMYVYVFEPEDKAPLTGWIIIFE